ncbi:MAG: hypothetical protein ABSF10_03860 [Verrucomicrobiota bacterium]|jgi:hypothetical protein
MNENENNFESLRRLLVLKRYETPPPGYFNYFSRQVLQRIRAGDTGKSANWLNELFGQPWLGKLLQAFNVKPVFASTFAGALCLLLFLGIIYGERPDLTSQPFLQAATTTASLTTASLTDASLTAVTPSLSQSTDPMGIVSSTDPVFSLQPGASLFGQQNSLAQPVSFSLPRN